MTRMKFTSDVLHVNRHRYQAKIDLITCRQDIVTKRYTPLEIRLVVLIQQKSLFEHLYDYHITCYHSNGFVQIVAYNFDFNVSSINGLK